MTSRIGKPNTATDMALHERLDSDGNRHFVMVAGAGSGKTTSLVKALAQIERTQGASLRRNGQQVACITYTEVAVEEIRGDVGNDELFHVSTIHSFLWTVIKPFQNNLREWVKGRLHEKIVEKQEKIDKPGTREATKARAAEDIERYQGQLAEIDRVKGFRYGAGSDYAIGLLGHSDILRIGPAFIQGHALMRSVLARRFPVIFVDESQDTDPAFVAALRHVAREATQGFCLGFFGDPVQKIYMQGAGPIETEDGWETLEKPENFRCPQAVLRAINRIRAEDDGLEQTRGRREIVDGEEVAVEGTARVLILPADDRRQERLENARQWLADQDNDDGWLESEDENALRLLVLVHRMAAARLGFPNLYSALNDRSSEDLSSGLIDGTAWVVRPFLSHIMPVALARQKGSEFEIMRLLRKHSPRFTPEAVAAVDTAGFLNKLRDEIAELVAMLVRLSPQQRISMDLIFAPSEIEAWPIDRLRPYARNAKMHGDDQVARIAASMAQFGWTVPCMVADDGELIAGHGRVLAATMLGLTEVPVIRLSHLDEAERRAYRIADNKLTELGDWDEAMLRDEIAGLLADDFDLSLLGIGEAELEALLQDPEAQDGDGPVEGEDDTPEAPATPVSVSGDLWQLGDHRLICGDSTSADVVGALLGDVKPLLMVTDPPYGVAYDPAWRNEAGAAKTKRTGKVMNDDRADWREAWVLFPGDVAYVWHGALHAAEVAESLTASGFAIRSQIIWAKDRLVLSRGDYHWQHEPCWYAVRTKAKGHWAGDRKQTTLWQIANKDQDSETVHGTQKPVECMRRPILNNSNTGQAVYEPFMGSGTTLIAAETTGRICYGVELDPAYVDVAIERWQSFTGTDALLAETGESFAALKARRRAA